MYVEFIKDHPAGIAKGVIVNVSDKEGKEYIKDKFGKESNEEDFQAFKSLINESKSPVNREAEFAKKSKAARLRVNGKPAANPKPKKPIGKQED